MQVVQELYNLVHPVYCRVCRYLVGSRNPICDTCCQRIDPIAPVTLSISRRRTIQVAAASRYDGDIIPLIMGKHARDPVAAREVGWLVTQRCSGFIGNYDAVVPVPLHWYRYMHRTFNQADIIAQAIAKHYNIPCVQALSRVSWSGSQGGRTVHERTAHVANAFAITDQVNALYNTRVLLVDDVMASGATIAAAARTLYTYRIHSVAAVVGARVV